MSRIVRRATSFDDLPREIAIYIFVKVPVKSLIRSSAVCKTWYGLVKNPDFVSTQISHAISSSSTVLFIPTYTKYVKHCYLISPETGFVFDKYEIPFTTDFNCLKVVGSVNGLVCLAESYSRTLFCPKLYVWNPSVRKYKCIDSSAFRKPYKWKVNNSYALGFGFHEPSGDYRVVRVMYDKGNQFEKLTPLVEVFSLRMNKWRPLNNTIVVPKVACDVGTTVVGTTVNSIVYWLKGRKTNYYWLKERKTISEGVWIVSFDLISEVFGQIKLPVDVWYPLEEIRCFQLMKFEGSLSVCVCYRLTEINKKFHHPCCIWLISHKDGIVSTTLRFRVVPRQFDQMFNITRGGALLMKKLYTGTSGLMSYNLKSMQYTNFNFCCLDTPCTVETFFIESLGGYDLLTSAT